MSSQHEKFARGRPSSLSHHHRLRQRSGPLSDSDTAVSPLNTIVQDLWLGDFIEAFEKMMANGYKESDLTTAPQSWENVRCVMANGIVCDLI